MTGKNYSWHKRWAVDLATCTATHDSGLVFSFAKAGSGEWEGRPVNLDEWQDRELQRMPLPDLAKHAKRLAREAGEAYLYQLKRRH